MHIQRYPDATTFYEAAAPLLVRNEAANCLPLGLCATLMANPTAYGQEAPYFVTVADGDAVVAAALMTPPYHLTLVQSDVPEAVELIAQETIVAYGLIPGVNGAASVSTRFADTWSELTGQHSQRTMDQRIYQLDEVLPLPTVGGYVRPAAPADRALLIAWLDAFHEEADGSSAQPSQSDRAVDQALAGEVRRFFVWDDGGPVSFAGCTGPTPHGIRIGPVYTPPQQRRKGYASACVAALSQLLLDEGRDFVFLFTDLANPTSNHIYQQIGYRPVVDIHVYAFHPAPE